jgi:SRSO17 transposase
MPELLYNRYRTAVEIFLRGRSSPESRGHHTQFRRDQCLSGHRSDTERLVEYAHRRHWVERFHQEAKGLLGWDQYQGRRWQGFQRHAVSVMLA